MGTIHVAINSKVCLSFRKNKEEFKNNFAGWHQYETSPLKLNIKQLKMLPLVTIYCEGRWKVSTIEIVFNNSLWISEWPYHFLSQSFGSTGTKHEMIIQWQKALFTPLNYLHFDKHHCKWWRLFHFRKEPVSIKEATSLD